MPDEGSLTLVGSRDALNALAPLADVHGRRRDVRIVEIHDTDHVSRAIRDSAAAIVVGGARTARTAGPALRADTSCVYGWVPDDARSLDRWVAAACTVAARDTAPTRPEPVVLFGQRGPRAAATLHAMQCRSRPTVTWTAERTTWPATGAALGSGPGVAVYAGHANSRALEAYGVIDAKRFVATWRSGGALPLGALVLLCCSAAARPKSGFSLAEILVTEGVAAAVVAAGQRTRNATNSVVAAALAPSLSAPTLADALTATRSTRAAFVSDFAAYRILGDPLAVLAGDAEACAAIADVYAPEPGEHLTTAEAWSNQELQRVEVMGLEPTTSALRTLRSTGLSYTPVWDRSA